MERNARCFVVGCAAALLPLASPASAPTSSAAAACPCLLQWVASRVRCLMTSGPSCSALATPPAAARPPMI